MPTISLIKRRATAPVAWLVEPIDWLQADQGVVTAQQFLKHAIRLAELLPDGRHAINLCDNRYLFMLSLCAVIIRQQTNLLPPNRNRLTQEYLAERFEQCYLLHDGLLSEDEATTKISSIDIRELEIGAHSAEDESIPSTPEIESEHLAVISFTSGSTGDSKANLKTWSTLAESSQVNASYMLPDKDRTYFALATVPGQHMWGLETSVLLPLFAEVCMADSRPFFPKDIQHQLMQLPLPRMLVATPLHLRALTGLQEPAANVDLLLCATAPLTQNLARKVENQFAGQLREIYGCSEVGSLAVRHTAHESRWQGFACFTFTQLDSETVIISADHLAQTVRLEDTIKLTQDNGFELGARNNDQIEIAGKRGSLQEVNRVLMEYEAISDGVVFFPPQDRRVPRLVALVVPDDREEDFHLRELRNHFAMHLDAAFIPRPIRIVSSLPREANGKLPAKALLALYNSL